MNPMRAGESLIYGFRSIVIFAIGLICGLGLASLGAGRITPLQALLFISIPSVILLVALGLVDRGVRTSDGESPRR